MKQLHRIKEHMTIRKIIGLVLLLACVVFFLAHITDIRRSFEYYNGSEAVEVDRVAVVAEAADHEHQTSLIGSQRVEQSFTAQADLISRVAILIWNPESYQSTGDIKASILDEKGKEVATTSLPANMTSLAECTIFSFEGDTKELNESILISRGSADRHQEGAKVTKGKTYKLVVESVDVQSTSTLAVVGNAVNGDAILHTVTFVEYHYQVAILFVLLMLLALLILLWPEKPIRSDIAQWILFALTPFVSCFIMFKIAGAGTRTIVRHFMHLDGCLNIILILLIQWVLLTLINRVGLSAILTTIFIFVFTTMNYFLIAARGTPLAFNDLLVWKTATEVAKSYSLTIDKFVLWGIVLTVFWVCVILAFDEARGCKNWKQRVLALAASCVLFSGTLALFRGEHITDKMYFSDWNPTKPYQEHGYMLGFAMSIKKSFLETPEEYTAEKVEKITDRYQSDAAEAVAEPTEKTPNLIVIMNESFSDLNAVGDLHINKDPMPFYHSLKENTIKGTMHTSILGGHTADTEFEFLTGDSMQFMPLKSVPFKTMISDKTPSLAWNMVDQGYAGNIAFHPGMRDSFGRDVAYPNLGFEKFISLEDIKDYEKVNGYMSDRSNYEVVQKEFEQTREQSDKPIFLFNVTIQNHGGYQHSDKIIEEGGIEFVDASQYYDSALQYLNLIKLSDNELEKIVTYFKDLDEPTVIVFFGDHQPGFAQVFCDILMGKPFEEWTLADKEKQYQVPFFIWANYDIEEESDVEISANYLHAYMLEKLGGKMTGYDKYLMDLRESIPIMTDICYYDSQGEIHNYETETEPNKEIRQYEWLQYSSLFDKKNRKNTFYYLK